MAGRVKPIPVPVILAAVNGDEDALAAVARTVAVAQLDGLVRAGRGAGRHGGDAERAVLQPYLRFQRGVAAGI